jgi:hypothetical protein
VDQPRPVVFLPGPGLPTGAWDRWVDLFRAHGYAATAADRVTGGPGPRPVLVAYGPGGQAALARAGPGPAAGVIAIDVPIEPGPDGAGDGEPVLVVISGQGPSVVTGPGWREIAGSCLSWLDAHEL